ncbi:MAG: DUF2937 family protein [Kiloniellales bacterium]
MIGRFVRMVLPVGGGAAGAQLPAFSDAYLQRLGGRLDQAEIEAARVAQAAADKGLAVPNFVHGLLTSADPLARRQGEVVQDQLSNLERLRSAFASLSDAVPLERPVRMLTHFDSDVATSAMTDFTPGVPLGSAGLTYAFAGFVVLLILAFVFRLLFGRSAPRALRQP